MSTRPLFTIRRGLVGIIGMLILGAGLSMGIDMARSENKPPHLKSTAAKTTDKVNKKAIDKAQDTQLMAHTNHNMKAKDYAYPTESVLKQMNGERQDIKDKVVFLTFDDGPDKDNTPKVLDILKKANVPATFFEVGRFVTDETAPIMKRQIQEGHAIGSHSFSHDYATLYPNGQADATIISQEFDESVAAFRHVLGSDYATHAFRYPGGRMSWSGIKNADQTLSKKAVYAMDWNAAVGDALTEDQQPKNVREMVAFNEKSLGWFPDHGVRIVLMHDSSGHELTTESLSQVIQFYKDQGYKFGILE
ncbi:MAG: polysaccharide deacetylase family protein [Aerococcus sp.]|nr:polysaccharide deacetylase family protein [Aerococcus sp.]